MFHFIIIIELNIKGGDLIDALQKGGQMAVETLIREQFGTFMYNNGKGQVINRAEYLRWKYMVTTFTLAHSFLHLSDARLFFECFSFLFIYL